MAERAQQEGLWLGTELDRSILFPEVNLVAHFGDLDSPLLGALNTFILLTVDRETLELNSRDCQCVD